MPTGTRKSDVVQAAIVEGTAKIICCIYAKTPAEFHNQLLKQADGDIKLIMDSLCRHIAECK